jgi:hypothetical protein
MWENLHDELLPKREFLLRLLKHFGLSALLVLVSLGAGMLGYHHWNHSAWIDAFLNASMLLGGMGPVGDMSYPAGKIFAGIYALYAGLVFLVSLAIMITPVIHRIMHKFHIDDDDVDSDAVSSGKI